MNDKEILKKRVEKAKLTITTEVLWLALLIVLGMIGAQVVAVLLFPASVAFRVLGVLIASVVGVYLGLRIRKSEKLVNAELTAVWDEIDVTLSRAEVTLDDILWAAKKEPTREDIIKFIGKKKRERVIDDLATEKLEEKEAEHIPHID